MRLGMGKCGTSMKALLERRSVVPLLRVSPPEQIALPEFGEQLAGTIRAKSFVQSAPFVSRHQELCRSTCTDLLGSHPHWLIGEEYDGSRNTLDGIREIMDAGGELEPLKKELERRFDRCLIESLLNLEDGKVEVGQLPIAAADRLDKKAGLDSQRTNRIEHSSIRAITRLRSLPAVN